MRMSLQTRKSLFEAYKIICKVGEKKPMCDDRFYRDLNFFLSKLQKKFISKRDAIDAMWKVFLASDDLYEEEE